MATSTPKLTLSAFKSKSSTKWLKFIFNRSNEDNSGSEFAHWQLNSGDSLNKFPLDYRVTSLLKERCASVSDIKPYLEHAYMSNVAVEFEHIQNEEERLWLYENYE
jgi:2-oxoglutarate dehydrogenase complex dehydrogenase (E1) component-like enzyme